MNPSHTFFLAACAAATDGFAVSDQLEIIRKLLQPIEPRHLLPDVANDFEELRKLLFPDTQGGIVGQQSIECLGLAIAIWNKMGRPGAPSSSSQGGKVELVLM